MVWGRPVVGDPCQAVGRHHPAVAPWRTVRKPPPATGFEYRVMRTIDLRPSRPGPGHRRFGWTAKPRDRPGLRPVYRRPSPRAPRASPRYSDYIVPSSGVRAPGHCIAKGLRRQGHDEGDLWSRRRTVRRQGRLHAHPPTCRPHDGRQRHPRWRPAAHLRRRVDRQDLEDRRVGGRLRPSTAARTAHAGILQSGPGVGPAGRSSIRSRTTLCGIRGDGRRQRGQAGRLRHRGSRSRAPTSRLENEAAREPWRAPATAAARR